ncbi:GGDEF domain-containing protein [Acuticoccus yangtzensis]|uniref:GGDEF domain-containing protein n=1 Tax=Acuticoccus yangtzensis TaxID=1443441 RepID=UPI0009499637|nr:GGDEF domain-containing protein [Acuticoccus yangtzensis]
MDAATSSVIAAITLGLTGCFLAWTWHTQRTTPALVWWCAAFFCASAASLAMSRAQLGSFRTPQATYADDLLSILAYVLIYYGFRRFNLRPLAVEPLVLAMVAYGGSHILLDWAPARFYDITIAINLVIITATVVEVWRAEQRDGMWRNIVLALLAFCVFGSACQFVTGAAGQAGPVHESDAVLMLVALMLPIVLSVAFGFSLLGMVMERDTARLRLAALADPLTGALNRRGASEWLRLQVPRLRASAVRHPISLAVLLVDVDHFKSVNDTHGHAVGDAALVAVAERLRTNARPDDAVVRLGGEEFAVLMPATSATDAFEAGERIRFAMAAEPLNSGVADLHLTVSVGCAVTAAMPTESGLARLIAEADGALYRAKRSGRNRVASASVPILTPA